MRTALVIGEGEIGRPIFSLLVQAYGPNEVKVRDIEPRWENEKFKFLHICFPQETNFVQQVTEYVALYDPWIVIVHSTLSPGVSLKLSSWLRPDAFCEKPGLFYSPVRGNTRDGLTWGLEAYTKYIAPVHLARLDDHFIDAVKEHLEGAGMVVKRASDSESLEYSKLFNLAYYGACIAVFQEIERICEKESLDYELVKKFIGSTESEAEKAGKKVPRPLYYGGHIGGHCVIPGIQKIVAKHPDAQLFNAILSSNIKRKRELTLSDS